MNETNFGLSDNQLIQIVIIISVSQTTFRKNPVPQPSPSIACPPRQPTRMSPEVHFVKSSHHHTGFLKKTGLSTHSRESKAHTHTHMWPTSSVTHGEWDFVSLETSWNIQNVLEDGGPRGEKTTEFNLFHVVIRVKYYLLEPKCNYILNNLLSLMAFFMSLLGMTGNNKNRTYSTKLRRIKMMSQPTAGQIERVRLGEWEECRLLMICGDSGLAALTQQYSQSDAQTNTKSLKFTFINIINDKGPTEWN